MDIPTASATPQSPVTFEVPGSSGGVAYEADMLPPGAQPSHIIVGLGDYYTTMPISTAKYIAIAVILGLIIFILVLLAWGFNEQRDAPTIHLTRRAKLRRVLKKLGPDSVVGTANRVSYYSNLDAVAYRDETTCTAVTTTRWIPSIGKCKCLPPYWGPTCKRETVSKGYLPAGSWNSDTGSLQVIGDPVSLPHLSFNMKGELGSTCTDMCNDTDGCNGVLWEPTTDNDPTRHNGTCTLLKSVTIAPGQQLGFDPNNDGNLYLKDPNVSLIYTDRVYIYGGRSPPRWWLYSRLHVPNGRVTNNQLEAVIDRLYTLSFFPDGTHGTTAMTGLYGLQPWDRSEFNTLTSITNTDPNYYVHRPGSALELPLDWYGLPMWVMYAYPT